MPPRGNSAQSGCRAGRLPSRRDGAAGARSRGDDSQRSPRLVYGRMTGWGQNGPACATRRARHQLHRALSGVLHAIGRAGGAPVPPLQSGRRFRRRRHAARVWRHLRAHLCPTLGPRGRSWMPRWWRGPRCCGRCSRGLQAADRWATRARREYPRCRCAVVRRLRNPGPQVRRHRGHQAKFYAELLDRMGLANAVLPTQHGRARWPDGSTTRKSSPRKPALNGLTSLPDPMPVSLRCSRSQKTASIRTTLRATAHVTVGNVEQPAPHALSRRARPATRRPNAAPGGRRRSQAGDFPTPRSRACARKASGRFHDPGYPRRKRSRFHRHFPQAR